MEKTKVMTIQFDKELYLSQISQFRGAIISAMTECNVLFHNHVDDNFRYSYPLVQYKLIGKKASIVALGEGTEAIGTFFANANFDIRIGDEHIHLEVDNIKADQVLIQAWDDMFDYRICRWLPLNQENHKVYQGLEGLGERCEFLEKILIGNILSFAKGLDIHLDHEVRCKITTLDEPRTLTFKGVKMMAFDAYFKSNVSLPNWIGLGKGVSHGFGTVTRKRKNNEIENKQ